jgi:fucose 4-O-acetylase-like acetyltransferase
MRIQSIDVARGLCIALVVWGHNHQFADTAANHMLWLIRMPLMFFIAGSFMSPKQSWATLLQTKAHALLKPFVVMALIQAPVRMALGQTTPDALAIGLLAGGGHYLPWIFSLWYLPHLWWVFILGYAIITQTNFDRIPQGSKALLMIAALVLGNLVIEQSEFWPDLPFSAGAIPRDLALFLLGYTCRTWLASWAFSWSHMSLPAITLSASYWLLQYVYADASLEVRAVWMTLCTLAGITLTMSIASGLSKIHSVNQILSACGRESIFILLFHFPLQSAATFVWSHILPNTPWVTATLSWLCSVGLSVAVARVMRMSHWSASLWLPMAQVPRASRPRLASLRLVSRSKAWASETRLDHGTTYVKP